MRKATQQTVQVEEVFCDLCSHEIRTSNADIEGCLVCGRECCRWCMTTMPLSYDALPHLAYEECGKMTLCKACAERAAPFLLQVEAGYTAWKAASLGQEVPV